MSRSGYSEELDNDWALIRWRGAVASSIRGKRGQAFLAEMVVALEALKSKRLIAGELEHNGEVCAIGAVGRARGLDMTGLDPEDAEGVAAAFGIAPALAREIVYLNDDWSGTTDESRFHWMRAWAATHINPPQAKTPWISPKGER